ncbi:MAG: glycoside hydrolase family 5 protein [Actinomycetes bacterium]
MRILTRLVVLSLGLALLPVPGAGAAPASGPPLSALRVVRADGGPTRVVDAQGRQVLLRGVNLNSLGDYWQANRRYPTVVPATAADWDRIAGQGFDVVRLLVSWSRLEPRRGSFDRAYLAQVRAAVAAAKARGIYTVIDMHQDAWGKHIATPRDVVCPEGTEPAKGWDGAPRWATRIAGFDTCTPGGREASPAVQEAWRAFYANDRGIRDELVRVWGSIARAFRTEPAVAGYDLLNEPNHGTDDAWRNGLATYYSEAIAAIRGAERSPGSIDHVILIEPTIYGQDPFPIRLAGGSFDDNLIFAPHNYGDSITSIPLEGLFDYFQSIATEADTPLWIGEYGWFEESTENTAALARYAAKEDAVVAAGSAWWQWRQACGDPHSIGYDGARPSDQVHFQRNACPGDENGGVVLGWACASRAYPQRAPGWITRLSSDRTTRTASVSGSTADPGLLVLWYPGRDRPVVDGGRARIARVRGGFRVTVPVRGDYTVSLAPTAG